MFISFTALRLIGFLGNYTISKNIIDIISFFTPPYKKPAACKPNRRLNF